MNKDDPKEFMSALQRIKERQNAQDKLESGFERNKEKYREALNRVVSTEDGRFVLRVIINKCFVFMPDTNATPTQRYERSILRDLYLSTIRPFIEKKLLQRLEV